MTTQSCEEALNRFANKDFAAWSGLPADCHLGDLAARFTLLEGSGTAVIGQQHHQTFFKMMRVEGYDDPVKVWFRDEAVLKLDAEYPDLSQELSELLGIFGKPADKLDYYQGVLLNANSEWVYPDRGLTLFLNRDQTMLAKLAVYPPMSLKDYVARFYTNEQLRENP